MVQPAQMASVLTLVPAQIVSLVSGAKQNQHNHCVRVTRAEIMECVQMVSILTLAHAPRVTEEQIVKQLLTTASRCLASMELRA